MPKKLYILVVSSIFFTISDIFFSISCIFPKISCMYLLYVLDIQQQVFLSETARHKPPRGTKDFFILDWRQFSDPKNGSLS